MSDSKPKVVQLSSVHPSFDTRIFHKISKSLAANNFDLDLIIQHPANEEKEGVNIIALPIARRKSDRVFKIIPILFYKCIQYPTNTIFHFHDPELIPVGLLLKLFGYKVIYDVHEDVPKDLLTKEWISKPLRKFLSKLILMIEKFSSRYFDGIITVVDTITNRFQKSNSKVVEIRNYPILIPNDAISLEKKGTKHPYVVYIGSLTSRRGIPEMVDAMSFVQEKNLSLYLGGIISEDGLKDKLMLSKGWDRTQYLGWVNQNELYLILKNALAGLLTLSNIPSHLDTLPVKLFEYMYAGIPVIASNFPLWREIVEGNRCGILINRMDPKEIAEAILWLYNNPKIAKEMGENGQRAVKEKYNWEQEEKKLLQIYRRITVN